MSRHDDTLRQPESESPTSGELTELELTTVAGGAQAGPPQASSLKAGASEVLMETLVNPSLTTNKK